MKPIAEAVLEGLIHNLRTPLNLVLGYAQKLQDKEGFASRIYDAGIRMDDQLQQTWDALQVRMSEANPIELNAWLQNEIIILSSVLWVKHHFCLTAVYSDKPVYASTSFKDLSEKIEQNLEELMDESGMAEVKILVSTKGVALQKNSYEVMIWRSENCN